MDKENTMHPIDRICSPIPSHLHSHLCTYIAHSTRLYHTVQLMLHNHKHFKTIFVDVKWVLQLDIYAVINTSPH